MCSINQRRGGFDGVPPEHRPTGVRIYRLRAQASNQTANANLGGVDAIARRDDSSQKVGPFSWELLVEGRDYYLDQSGLWFGMAAQLGTDDFMAVSYTTAVGDTVGVSGGISGVVAEIDAFGLWIEVDGGGQFQVRWGDEIKAGDRKGGLTPTPDSVTPDADLVEQLKAWRLETARATGMPAYVILHDATIETIAGIRPQTETQLAAVPGIGPAKLEAHGDAILEICAE